MILPFLISAAERGRSRDGGRLGNRPSEAVRAGTRPIRSGALPHELLPRLAGPILSSSILKLIRLPASLLSKLYHLSRLPLPPRLPVPLLLCGFRLFSRARCRRSSAAAHCPIIPKHERMSSFFFLVQVVLSTAASHKPYLFPLFPCLPKISPSPDPPLCLILSSFLYFISLLPSSLLSLSVLLSFPSRRRFLIVVDRLLLFLSPSPFSPPPFLFISLITRRDKGI